MYEVVGRTGRFWDRVEGGGGFVVGLKGGVSDVQGLGGRREWT